MHMSEQFLAASRILSRVLLPQTGHKIHSVFSIIPAPQLIIFLDGLSLLSIHFKHLLFIAAGFSRF